jgi:hypothetical protein
MMRTIGSRWKGLCSILGLVLAAVGGWRNAGGATDGPVLFVAGLVLIVAAGVAYEHEKRRDRRD